MKTAQILSDHCQISSHLRGIYDEARINENIIVAYNLVANEIIKLSQECKTSDQRNNLHRALTSIIKFI